jgi:hypothetical protein
MSYYDDPSEIWWPLEQNLRNRLAFRGNSMEKEDLAELNKLLREKLLVYDPDQRATGRGIANYPWLQPGN